VSISDETINKNENFEFKEVDVRSKGSDITELVFVEEGIGEGRTRV